MSWMRVMRSLRGARKSGVKIEKTVEYGFVNEAVRGLIGKQALLPSSSMKTKP